jgi:hypothetical protein
MQGEQNWHPAVVTLCPLEPWAGGQAHLRVCGGYKVAGLCVLPPLLIWGDLVGDCGCCPQSTVQITPRVCKVPSKFPFSFSAVSQSCEALEQSLR